MAKYGISAEGVSALTQLASDMSTINDDIEENGRTLKTTVSGIGDGLGIYEDEILDLVTNVNNAQEKGRESVNHLTQKVNSLASEIEGLISMGLGSK